MFKNRKIEDLRRRIRYYELKFRSATCFKRQEYWLKKATNAKKRLNLIK